MFTNYYKLMNISPAATEEEINTALEQSTLSGALVEEMKMVLQNKSLKALYDEELKLYEAATLYEHYDEVLNFFVNRATNAFAESFNAKIKAFRAALRGVTDLKFFLFRLTKLYA